MIQDQILAEIDDAISKVKRAKSGEEAGRIYEQLGKTVTRLRGTSIAYRKSERKKGARIREALRTTETREEQG